MTIDMGSNLDVEVGEIKVQKRKPVGMPTDTVKIILEDNNDIPPTGLFVGLNGKGFLISPGVAVDVPAAVVEILEHAVVSTPVIDPQDNQVLGYRDRMKYPFRRVA